MQLRSLKVSILVATFLPLVACGSGDQQAPDGDEPGPVSELGAALLTDMTERPVGPDMSSCMLIKGCPVALPVTKPVIYKFWGSSDNNVWAVGKGGLTLNWDGSNWRRFGNPATGDLWAVWGSSANDVWAVGDSATILHWNGTAWSKTAGLMTMSGFNDVWGTSASDAWAVGDGGAILHWDGTKWSQVSIPFVNGFMAVYGAAANDVWVGGEAGLLLHWDGTKMNQVATSSPETIWRIRGSSVSNVYLTTEPSFGSSSIQRWDGTKWSAVSSGGGPELWVIDANKVWSGSVFGGATPTPTVQSNYWNGLVWTNKNVGITGFINAIWVTDKDGWASSSTGLIGRYNGTSWVRSW